MEEFEDKFVKGATWFLVQKIGDDVIVGWFDYYSTRTDYPHLYDSRVRPEAEREKKGKMTEAVKLIVYDLFTTKEIERIEALTDAPNVGPQRVLENVGFKREGLLRKRSFKNGVYRDEYIYGILREDWQKT